MNVRLRPELERLIKQDIQRGPYRSVDEFVERAVAMLHEQEAWLANNRTEIKAKIDECYAAAQRGELIDDGDVRTIMKKRKITRPPK